MHRVCVGDDEWYVHQVMQLFQQHVEVIKLGHSGFLNREPPELCIKLIVETTR